MSSLISTQYTTESISIDSSNQEVRTESEPMSIDEIIDLALSYCTDLPYPCNVYVNQIQELKSRLYKGRLHLAVLGQFNRGKSTFLNALTGFDLLPTSVLPSTSVPTIISYGQELTCRVRFLDSRPDLFVRQSLISIQDTLKKYVDEENNPNNQLCVKEVEVTCPGPLLENGSVLIDTPGFGSTQVHNTRTALTVLTECDAAIFLLSADPPLTQTELEFLKQVNLYVPRIFFVVNKTDLLSESDLAVVDRFITDVFVMQMKYPPDLKLFHICARKGIAAHGNLESAEWIESGINVIKTEVLDFMVREKYFTLSEALNDKFHEAINGIAAKISEEIDTYKQPLGLLESEYATIRDQHSQLKKTTEKETALIAIEETAVIKFLNEQITAAIDTICQELTNDFSGLIVKTSANAAAVESISLVFVNLTIEKLKKFHSVTLNNCNKPIRKAIQIHIREYNQLIEKVRSVLGEKISSTMNVNEKIDQCEIESSSWNVGTSIDLQLSSVWTDVFRNKEQLHDRFKNIFNFRLKEILPLQLKLICDALTEEIHSSFVKVNSLLEKDYGSLIKLLDDSIKKKDEAIKERIAYSGSRSSALQKTLDRICSVRSLLHKKRH